MSCIQTKTNKAVELFKSGCLKEALAIFKTFRLGFTREERRVIQIASECLNGHSSFYVSIGIDANEKITQASKIINDKYLSEV